MISNVMHGTEFTDWSTLDSNSCKDNIPSFSFAASGTSIPATFYKFTNYLTQHTVTRLHAIDTEFYIP